jgi:prepilin-type N-terminal cleavage/methylation domain-containing protein
VIDTNSSKQAIAPKAGATSSGTSIRRPFSQRAFSFIELLSVMAVISVVSGFAVVSVNGGSTGTALETGSRKVAQYLELARSEAISRHAVVRFVAAREWAHRDDATLRRFSPFQPVGMGCGG